MMTVEIVVMNQDVLFRVRICSFDVPAIDVSLLTGFVMEIMTVETLVMKIIPTALKQVCVITIKW